MNQILLKEHGFSYFDRFVANNAAMECETRATIVMLAIEAHRARYGRPPSSLNDLVPDILETAPLDPTNGQGYGYRLLTDDPAGRTYLLYSLGVDASDDGGADDSWFDWYNPDKTGVDHVINKTRVEK